MIITDQNNGILVNVVFLFPLTSYSDSGALLCGVLHAIMIDSGITSVCSSMSFFYDILNNQLFVKLLQYHVASFNDLACYS